MQKRSPDKQKCCDYVVSILSHQNAPKGTIFTALTFGEDLISYSLYIQHEALLTIKTGNRGKHLARLSQKVTTSTCLHLSS